MLAKRLPKNELVHWLSISGLLLFVVTKTHATINRASVLTEDDFANAELLTKGWFCTLYHRLELVEHQDVQYVRMCAELFEHCAPSIILSWDLGSEDQNFAHPAVIADDLYGSVSNRIEQINGYKSDIRSPILWKKRQRRNGISRPTKLWPNGKIPYLLSPNYTSYERALLAKAVKKYHEETCVRFVPRAASQGDFLYIGKIDGCFSEVGRTRGLQALSLDDGCMEYATIIHEMMHVVGFYHEHERWDRDKYIDIIWQNIDKAAFDQFGKVDLGKTSYYGQPYDYDSILHYDSLAFSKNGFPTMLPKKSGLAAKIGNAMDFSDIDLAKINRMYNCPIQEDQSHVRSQSLMIFTSPPSYKAMFIDSESYSDFSSKLDRNWCRDKITVCLWVKDRCKSRSLLPMMKTLCTKTCELC